MSKSKQAVRGHRDFQDKFERQKVRHIKHDKEARHLQEVVDIEESGLLSSADLRRLDGYEGF